MTVARATWRLGPHLFVQTPSPSPLASAMRTVFAALETDAAPPDARVVTLDLATPDGDHMSLLADGVPITRIRSPDHLPSMLEGSLGGLAVQSRADCLVFHAGCVLLGGQSVLLLGGKGSGKSTLSLWLARQGARYFADEHVFVRLSDRRVEAFPKAATIKRGAASLFEEGPVYPDAVRGPLRYILPPHVARPGEETSISLIILPRYDGEAENASTPLQAHETALMFVQQCFGGLGRSPEALRAVAELARHPASLLDYRDLAWAEQAIRRFLTELP
jgi:hypothetical protein